MSDFEEHLADGLFEAERGRWRSAAESFERCARARPGEHAFVVAAAICRLALKDAAGAVLLLETSACAGAAAAAPWDVQYPWLCAAARLASGDPDGAQRAAAALPEALRARVDAHLLLRAGDYGRGVRALLFAFGRARSGPRL